MGLQDWGHDVSATELEDELVPKHAYRVLSRSSIQWAYQIDFAFKGYEFLALSQTTLFGVFASDYENLIVEHAHRKINSLAVHPNF